MVPGKATRARLQCDPVQKACRSTIQRHCSGRPDATCCLPARQPHDQAVSAEAANLLVCKNITAVGRPRSDRCDRRLRVDEAVQELRQ